MHMRRLTCRAAAAKAAASHIGRCGTPPDRQRTTSRLKVRSLCTVAGKCRSRLCTFNCNACNLCRDKTEEKKLADARRQVKQAKGERQRALDAAWEG